MEVHHPHHPSHKKKWSEYILEFMMLFLAVSLGFLAENIREGYVEKERSHELAKMLESDVKDDLSKAKSYVEGRKITIQQISELVASIEKNGIQADNYKQYELFAKVAIKWVFFEPKTANLDQIINSGSLRYFKKNGLTDSISKYKASLTNLLNREEREKAYYYSYLQPFVLQNMDLQEMDPYMISFRVTINELFNQIDSTKSNIKGKKLILVPNDPIQQNKIKNTFRFYSGILQSSNKAYIGAYIEQCESLLKILEKNKE
jgi:hypothetical protein